MVGVLSFRLSHFLLYDPDWALVLFGGKFVDTLKIKLDVLVSFQMLTRCSDKR